jgi:hypothetical protein
MTERDDPGGAVEPSTSPAPYGDNGFLEDYTAQVRSAPIGLAVLVTSNAVGQTQHIAANYRPRSSLLLMSRYWARSSPAPHMPSTSSPASPERTYPAAALDGGCRTKPFRNGRCTLAEARAREAAHDEIAPIGQRATEAMAVFGAHP